LAWSTPGKEEKRTRKPAILRSKSELGKIAATAIFAEGIRASDQQQSAKPRYRGNYGRDGVDDRRRSRQKDTSALTKVVNIMGPPMRISMRWLGMTDTTYMRRSEISNARCVGRRS